LGDKYKEWRFKPDSHIILHEKKLKERPQDWPELGGRLKKIGIEGKNLVGKRIT